MDSLTKSDTAMDPVCNFVDSYRAPIGTGASACLLLLAVLFLFCKTPLQQGSKVDYATFEEATEVAGITSVRTCVLYA